MDSRPPLEPELEKRQVGAALLFALGSLYPFIAHYSLFAGLFYFGDDFFLLADLQKFGFWHQALLPFAENFIPLYRLISMAVLYLSHGSHQALVAALWITHASNVGLFALWMLKSRFNYFVTAFAAGVFGLSYSNIETLTWTVQWSAVLSSTFFFLACLVFSPAINEGRDLTKRELFLVMLCSTVSPLFFSRGILVGPVLAAVYLLFASRKEHSWLRQGGWAGLLALPGVAVGLIVCLQLAHNPNYIVQHPYPWRKALSFGAWYLTLNPVPNFYYGRWSDFTWNRVIIYGAIKGIVFTLSLILASPAQRRLLATLLIFELGYAAQLAYGRSGGELVVAMSSRYQYISLITFTPAVGLLGWRVLERLTPRFFLRPLLSAAAIVAAVWLGARHWTPELPGWVEWRGLSARRVIAQPADRDKVEPPIAGGVPVTEVRELQALYHLH